MTYTKCDVTREVNIFKDGIKQRNLGNWNQLFKDVFSLKDAIHSAVDLAYNDAKRTMNGINEMEKEKQEALGNIENGLMKYFNNSAPNSEGDFDTTHMALCDKWCKAFATSTNLRTYGKAQKIINMSFKYLYCCDYINKDYFKFCHMPLDSFTLEWFKRRVLPDINSVSKKKMSKWSNIEESCKSQYYDYSFYRDNIREYIKREYIKTELSPLELEFIEWPQIQKEMSAEEFLFKLGVKPKEKEEIKKKTLNDKYQKIKEILDKIINEV